MTTVTMQTAVIATTPVVVIADASVPELTQFAPQKLVSHDCASAELRHVFPEQTAIPDVPNHAAALKGASHTDAARVVPHGMEDHSESQPLFPSKVHCRL